MQTTSLIFRAQKIVWGTLAMVIFTGIIFLSIDKNILKVAGHGQNISKMDHLKVGVDSFSYFSLIFSYFIF